jgi:GNAT superfamily N-acetyltransferase
LNHERYKDEQGNIEGILLLQIYEKSISPFENAIEISHLATHPKNIRSPINERELNQVKGVGTHLLRFAERQVLERNKQRLILKTLDSAAGYYAKEGFETYPHYRILFKTADKIRQEISPLKQVA